MQNDQDTPETRLEKLVQNLQEPERLGHSVDTFETVETHISIVLLTGPYAYKFKKPLDLEFLNFSTLERRREACRNELRLNRRTAPDLYLDVVSVSGTVEDPALKKTGEPIEYAVKMKQFPSSARFDRVVRRGDISDEKIDGIADQLADVHENAEQVGMEKAGSRPDHVREEVEETYRRMLDVFDEMDRSTEQVEQVGEWLLSQVEKHRERIIRRTRQGCVRDVHGDLHLENIAWIDERAVFFDCIEFNASYRRIDVINELAFLSMDLERVGESGGSWRLVNRYLERTGDYMGVFLLPLFKTYRALVRAMVTGIKCVESSGDGQRPVPSDTMKQFLAQMHVPLNRGPSILVMMHGLSGSGKTAISQQLLQRMGGVRVRSDVERKRLFNVDPYGEGRDANVEEEDLYSADASRRTYERLGDLAGSLLETGYPVFVDATFLRKTYREPFFELAKRKGVPVRIIHLEVPEKELRRRLRERQSGHTISDADQDVLEHQINHLEALTPEEQKRTLTVDASGQVTVEPLVDPIRSAGESEA